MTLTVSAFYMDRTEVTYGHWKRVYNWAVTHGYSFDHEGLGRGKNHPVQTVNWWDCVKWCNARSEMEGRPPAYRMNGEVYRTGQSSPDVDLDGSGYRLPTSEEWEYAARGGLHGHRFPWGDTISHARANYFGQYGFGLSPPSYDLSSGSHPLYCPTTFPYSAPVASFAANRYGLYDMAGNIWEWTTTVFGGWGKGRDIRGGGWNGGECRCGARCGEAPDTIYMHYGFRSVRRR